MTHHDYSFVDEPLKSTCDAIYDKEKDLVLLQIMAGK